MGGFPGAPNPTSGPAGPVGVTGEALVYLGEVVEVLTGPEDPIGYIIAVVGEVLELVADLVNALIKLFSGRPKEEATIDVAKRLMQTRNTASQVYGVVLWRLLNDYDIVISSTNKLLDLAVKQFAANLQAQSVRRGRIRTIISDIFNRSFQDGAPIPPELTKPLAVGLQLWGTQHLLDSYNKELQRFTNQGYDQDTAARKALRFVYQHSSPFDLLSITITQKPTPPPPPSPPPPPPPAPPPGGGQQGGCFPQGGDELTDGFNCLAAKIDSLTSSITSQGATPPPPGGAENCCQQVVAAIATVASAIGGVADAIPAPSAGGGAVDLTPVVAALNQLVAAVTERPSPPETDLTPLVDAVNRLDDAMAANDPCVCDELKKLAEPDPTQLAKHQETVKWLADNLFDYAAISQVLGS